MLLNARIPQTLLHVFTIEIHFFRFEYSEFKETLLTLNPLSYHQMGLAVPGSFVRNRKSIFRKKLLPCIMIDI